MQTPTYNEQFNKITEAYIQGKIQPYDREFCFCGTLGYVKTDFFESKWDYDLYDWIEYHKMEIALLKTIRDETIGAEKCESIYIDKPGESAELRHELKTHVNYETALFNGMSAALEVLKQIHISRGEIIDEVPQFKKRKLQTA